MVLGIVDETSSAFTLDGERAMQTHERWFGPLSVGDHRAYCQVLGPAGRILWSTTLPLLVQGSE